MRAPLRAGKGWEAGGPTPPLVCGHLAPSPGRSLPKFRIHTQLSSRTAQQVKPPGCNRDRRPVCSAWHLHGEFFTLPTRCTEGGSVVA